MIEARKKSFAIVLQLAATDVVYNEGLWMLCIESNWPMNRLEDFWSNVTAELTDFQQSNRGTSVLFKTTTPEKDVCNLDAHHSRELAHAIAAGINVTDAYA